MKLQRMGHPHPVADSGKGNAKEEADSSAALRNDKTEVAESQTEGIYEEVDGVFLGRAGED
jgi:hypothetical protein